MPKRSPFTPALFEFLSELSARTTRSPGSRRTRRATRRRCGSRRSSSFGRFAPLLEAISRHFVASDKKVGGSLMRVHRDVRFSKDKAPYKTNVGIQFRHEAGKDVHAPGFYVHLSPLECFLGAGMWHPESSALRSVREGIVSDPKGYEEVAMGKSFTRWFELEGESLTRAPKGFDPEHPLIDELRRKDHIGVHRLAAEDFTKPGAVAKIAKRFEAAAPYMEWMCRAVGVAF